MENYLYFAENLVTTGGVNTSQTAFMVPASYYVGADPISTTTTAVHFKDPGGEVGGRIRVLLKHATTANGGGYKQVVRALAAAMNSNRPTNDGFVVFADEEADNGTITGAATKTVEYSPVYSLCTPDSSTLTAGNGSVAITIDKDYEESGVTGLTSTDIGLPRVTVHKKGDQIVTEGEISLVGLKASGTANDAIGIGTTPAYAYQHLDAVNGKVYETQLICDTLAAGGGSTDINIVYAAAATIDYDEAAGTAYGVNGGGVAAGATVSNIAAGVKATNAHYMYVSVGDTNGDASVFTAGRYLYRTIGKNPLISA